MARRDLIPNMLLIDNGGSFMNAMFDCARVPGEPVPAAVRTSSFHRASGRAVLHPA